MQGCLQCHAPRLFHRRLEVRAGAGFGDGISRSSGKKQNRKVNKIKRGKKTVEKALKLVDGKGKKGEKKIDPEEAAKGRVDFAQVKDWGGGEEDDLDSLQVEAFSENASGSGKPFYEQMAKHLQLLQAKGALSIAQDDLPDYKNWSFSEKRYLQFLEDQLHIHQVLEQSIADLVSGSISGIGGGPAGILNFRSECGLDRTQAFEHDIESLIHSAKEGGRVNECSGPTLQVVAYGKYISQLCSRASSDDAPTERNQNFCKLIAHAYSIRVFHLTTGTRIGATATEKLNLFPRQATDTFQKYPDDVEDPLEQFIKSMNACGLCLSSEEREIVLEELAASFKKTALTLASLAHVD